MWVIMISFFYLIEKNPDIVQGVFHSSVNHLNIYRSFSSQNLLCILLLLV